MSINLQPDSLATLVGVDVLTQNAQLSALNTSNPALVASLLNAATVAIQRYTMRDLIQTSYTQYISGGNFPYDKIFLPEFPVTQITRVGSNPQTVLIVTNGNGTLNQRATIATIGTGVTLTRVASAVTTTTTLQASDYPTISALATGINALGNGWQATIQGAYGNHPTADLKPLQGAYTTLNGGADLQLYPEEIGSTVGMSWVPDDSEGGWGGSAGWRLDERTGILYGRFPRGHLNIRVDYTAGFAIIPADLQEACLQLVLDFYNAQIRDQTQSEGRMGMAAFTNIAGHMSSRVKAICSYYRDRASLNLHR